LSPAPVESATTADPMIAMFAVADALNMSANAPAAQ